MKGWYGNKYGHSLASKGIKSKANSQNISVTKEELMSQIMWFMGDCKYVTEEEMNDYDDYKAICSLKIDKILFYESSYNELIAVVEGEIAGIKDKYFIGGYYYAGSYEDPPDAEMDWGTLSQEIEFMEKQFENPYTKDLYKRQNMWKLETFRKILNE